ncbi:MAG: molecular chaperone DnaK, partial [Bacteroidia bacterium]
DQMIFQTEKQLKEFGDKLPVEKKEPIETALAELKTAHEARDVAAIDVALETMNTAWQAASQEMYAATQEAQGGQPGPDASAEGQGGDDEVTDVDFEEVKEEEVKEEAK